MAKASSYKWYVLATEPKRQGDVRKQILRKAKIESLPISRIVVPKHVEDVKQKDGSLRPQQVLSFPGYLLIYCDMTDDVLHFFDKLVTTGGVACTSLYRARKDGQRYDTREYVHDVDADAEFETRIGSTRVAVFGLLPPKPTFTQKIPGKKGAVRSRLPKAEKPMMRPDPHSEWGFAFVRDRETGEIRMKEHDEHKAVREWRPIGYDTEALAVIFLRGQQKPPKPTDVPKPDAKPPFEPGQEVFITEGMFQNLSGVLKSLKGNDATVTIKIMGRTADVKANPLQLRPVTADKAPDRPQS